MSFFEFHKSLVTISAKGMRYIDNMLAVSIKGKKVENDKNVMLFLKQIKSSLDELSLFIQKEKKNLDMIKNQKITKNSPDKSLLMSYQKLEDKLKKFHRALHALVNNPNEFKKLYGAQNNNATVPENLTLSGYVRRGLHSFRNDVFQFNKNWRNHPKVGLKNTQPRLPGKGGKSFPFPIQKNYTKGNTDNADKYKYSKKDFKNLTGSFEEEKSDETENKQRKETLLSKFFKPDEHIWQTTRLARKGLPIIEEPQEYELTEMSELIKKNPKLAKNGKIYLAKEGNYIVRDPQGEVRQDTLDSEIKLNNFPSDLKKEELKNRILDYTTDKGHTKGMKLDDESTELIQRAWEQSLKTGKPIHLCGVINSSDGKITLAPYKQRQGTSNMNEYKRISDNKKYTLLAPNQTGIKNCLENDKKFLTHMTATLRDRNAPDIPAHVQLALIAEGKDVNKKWELSNINDYRGFSIRFTPAYGKDGPYVIPSFVGRSYSLQGLVKTYVSMEYDKVRNFTINNFNSIQSQVNHLTDGTLGHLKENEVPQLLRTFDKALYKASPKKVLQNKSFISNIKSVGFHKSKSKLKHKGKIPGAVLGVIMQYLKQKKSKLFESIENKVTNKERKVSVEEKEDTLINTLFNTEDTQTTLEFYKWASEELTKKQSETIKFIHKTCQERNISLEVKTDSVNLP